MSQDVLNLLLVFLAAWCGAGVAVRIGRPRRGDPVKPTWRPVVRGGVVVVGDGRMAQTLAEVLHRYGEHVTLVVSSSEVAERLRGLDVTVVGGDALDPDVLEQSGLSSVATLVSLSGRPAFDALVAKQANIFRVPSVHLVDSSEPGVEQTVLHHVAATRAFGGAIQLPQWEAFLEDVGPGAARELSLLTTYRRSGGFDALRALGLPVAVRRGARLELIHDHTELHDGDRVVVLAAS